MSALLANPALPGLLHNISHPSSQALGALGEQLCYHLLTARGYLVSGTHPGEQRGDLRIITPDGECLRVEVKTARMGSNRLWRFSLRKGRKTNISHADVVILLCAMKTGYVVPFVVPVSAFGSSANFSIRKDPYTYAGKFARFRQPMHSLTLEREREDDETCNPYFYGETVKLTVPLPIVDYVPAEHYGFTPRWWEPQYIQTYACLPAGTPGVFVRRVRRPVLGAVNVIRVTQTQFTGWLYLTDKEVTSA